IAGGRYAWKAYQAHRAQKKSSAIVSFPAATESQNLPAALSTTSDTNSASSPLDLAIAAAASTPVRVVADGKIVFDGELPGGESRRFVATDRLEVRAADPAAVLLELNGQTVASLGSSGSSGTIVLTQ